MASQTYEYTHELPDLKNSTDFKATPFFPPIPDVDLSFCFKYSYREFPTPTGPDSSLFRLKLASRPSSEIPSSWFMNLDVKIMYEKKPSLWYTFFAYKTITGVLIRQMTDMYFTDVVSLDTADKNMKQNNCLLLKCNFKIWEDSKESLQCILRKNLLLANLKELVDFSSIYEPCILSDIEFKIDDKSIPAHKAVIAARSPDFRKMLNSDFKESRTSIVNIIDSTHEVFSTFVKYFYTGEIEDKSWSNVRELYKLAVKYDVAILKRQCQQVIRSCISLDRVTEVLILAYEYDDDALKEAATHFAIDHIKDVIAQESWKEIVESYSRIAYDVVVNFVPK